MRVSISELLFARIGPILHCRRGPDSLHLLAGPRKQAVDARRVLRQDHQTGNNKHPTRHDRQDQPDQADENQPDTRTDSENLLQFATLICVVNTTRKFLSACIFNTILQSRREKPRSGFDNGVEMKTIQQLERIYRVWSERREDEIAVRIQYSIVEEGPTTVFKLGAREEWV